MPIAINGSGTITGISVGGIPDGVVDTDVIAANAVTTAKLGTNEASGLCKAWVNFNGDGTVAIRDSYNVSSITDNDVGDYTVNFTTAMPDANYVACGASGRGDITATGGRCFLQNTTSPSVSAFRFNIRLSATNSKVDDEFVYVAIFR
jgi:hypothetical protein